MPVQFQGWNIFFVRKKPVLTTIHSIHRPDLSLRDTMLRRMGVVVPVLVTVLLLPVSNLLWTMADVVPLTVRIKRIVPTCGSTEDHGCNNRQKTKTMAFFVPCPHDTLKEAPPTRTACSVKCTIDKQTNSAKFHFIVNTNFGSNHQSYHTIGALVVPNVSYHPTKDD